MMGVGAKRALGLYRSCAPRQQHGDRGVDSRAKLGKHESPRLIRRRHARKGVVGGVYRNRYTREGITRRASDLALDAARLSPCDGGERENEKKHMNAGDVACSEREQA